MRVGKRINGHGWHTRMRMPLLTRSCTITTRAAEVELLEEGAMLAPRAGMPRSSTTPPHTTH